MATAEHDIARDNEPWPEDCWIDEETATALIPILCDIPWAEDYCPHAPEPPQQAFLTLDCLDALYGGAAGGGKSDAMLMAALQYVDVPGYSAIIMRRTFAELSLEGALMSRALTWLGHTDAKWDGNRNRWTFPSGAVLQFGYLSGMQDRARYQSAEFQFIGIDELTDWDEADFKFMFSRLRRTEGISVPLRMRAATNPGGRGHRWVKARYLDLADGASRQERVFIPAKLTDNPHLDQVGYMQALQQLDPDQARMLIDGDWDAREPGDWMIGDPRWVDAAVELGRQIWQDGPPNPVGDCLYSGTDWGEHTQSYVIWEMEQGGIFVPPGEVVAQHEDPALTSHAIVSNMLKYNWPWRSARYDAAGVQSMRTMMGIARKIPGLEQLRSTKIPFNMYKKETVGYMRMLFRRTAEGHTTRVIAIHPDNTELIWQLKEWRRKGPETDDAIKENDHGPDALLAGIAPVAKRFRVYIEKEIQEASNAAVDNAYLNQMADMDPEVLRAIRG